MSVAVLSASAQEPISAVTVSDDDLDIATRSLVNDLHTARPAVFWTDLIGCAAVGWFAFGLALWAPLLSSRMVAASVVSAFALYRGLCFTHELVHLRRGAVRGFETAWNLVFGVPLLLPSFTYAGVHQSHHNLSTYGTKEDPEYLPFAKSRRLIFAFAFQSSVLIPAMLLLRFLVLAPVGLAWPGFYSLAGDPCVFLCDESGLSKERRAGNGPENAQVGSHDADGLGRALCFDLQGYAAIPDLVRVVRSAYHRRVF